MQINDIEFIPVAIGRAGSDRMVRLVLVRLTTDSGREGWGEAAIAWRPEIYEADVDTLLEVLAACPADVPRVMIVGHNPGFEDLVAYLSDHGGDTATFGNPMPTAALAHLEMPDDWRQLTRGCAHLLGITRPRELT